MDGVPELSTELTDFDFKTAISAHFIFVCTGSGSVLACSTSPLYRNRWLLKQDNFDVTEVKTISYDELDDESRAALFHMLLGDDNE